MPHESHCVCEQNVSVWPYALLPTADTLAATHGRHPSPWFLRFDVCVPIDKLIRRCWLMHICVQGKLGCLCYMLPLLWAYGQVSRFSCLRIWQYVMKIRIHVCKANCVAFMRMIWSAYSVDNVSLFVNVSWYFLCPPSSFFANISFHFHWTISPVNLRIAGLLWPRQSAQIA